jgi:hypothetical protein
MFFLPARRGYFSPRLRFYARIPAAVRTAAVRLVP